MENGWSVYLFTYPNSELKGDETKKMRKIGITSNIEGRGKGAPGERIINYVSEPLTKNHARCIELACKIITQYGGFVYTPILGGGQRNRITEYFFCDEAALQEMMRQVEKATKLINRNHAEDKKNIIKERVQMAEFWTKFYKKLDLPHHSSPPIISFNIKAVDRQNGNQLELFSS